MDISLDILLLVALSNISVSYTLTCPQNGYSYDVTSGFCITLLPNLMTWTKSKKECERRGERLAWLDTAEKHNFFKNIARPTGDDFWVGGYKGSSGVWEWSEDVGFSYEAWCCSQPDGTGDCITSNKWANYDWDDYVCYAKQRAVCERVPASPTSTVSSLGITSTNPVNTASSTEAVEQLPRFILDRERTSGIGYPSPLRKSEVSSLRYQETKPVITFSISVPDFDVSPANSGQNISTSDSISDIYISSNGNPESIESSSVYSNLHLPHQSSFWKTPLDLTISMSTYTSLQGAEELKSDISEHMSGSLVSVTESQSLLLQTVLDRSHQHTKATEQTIDPADVSYQTSTMTITIKNLGEFVTQVTSSPTKESTIELYTMPVTSPLSCPCFCDNYKLSSLELKRKQVKIRENLLLDKRTLSKTLGRYRSAGDERMTSVGIGYVGIILLVLFLCFIIGGDLRYIVRFCNIHRMKTKPVAILRSRLKIR